jgi:hypothetical protein
MKEKLLSLSTTLATYVIDLGDKIVCEKAATELGLDVSFANSIGEGPPVKTGRLVMFVNLKSQDDNELLINRACDLEVDS